MKKPEGEKKRGNEREKKGRRSRRRSKKDFILYFSKVFEK